MLSASTKLASLPVVEDALRAGKLSGSQAVAVTDAASVAPSAQGRAGQGRPAVESRPSCASSVCAPKRPPIGTGKRPGNASTASATCGRSPTPRVLATCTSAGPSTRSPTLEARLQPFVDDEFQQARTEDRHEEREAYAFDALLRMLDSVTAGSEIRSRRNLMLIRVDLEALQRDTVEGDELCEIPGLGPITVSAARALLGESIVKLVITNGVDVRQRHSPGSGTDRSPTSRAAVPTTGLHRRRMSIAPAARSITATTAPRTHHTRVDECDPLCKPHHDLKTYQGWALVEGTGKRRFVRTTRPAPPSHTTNKAPP